MPRKTIFEKHWRVGASPLRGVAEFAAASDVRHGVDAADVPAGLGVEVEARRVRLVREMYPTDVAIVYVSPCFARKDEVYDPEFEGAVPS